jgi:predicted ferric reductase
MNLWGTVTWDIARTGGFTAYILLTLSVAIGLALTLHLQSGRWPRIINSELHNFLTLLALIFTVIHVLAVWIDPFTHFGWNEVFIPFLSHYRPIWMAFGIVSLYLGLAIGLSTWLRPYIGYKLWRKLHVFTLLSFLLVTVHGIATGSDTRTWWGAGIYLISVLLIGTLLWMRLIKPANAQSKAHPVMAVTTIIVMLVGSLLTVIGPLQSGWNAFANGGNGSGQFGSIASASTKAHAATQAQTNAQTTAFPVPFSANVQGTMTQTGPDFNGNVTLTMDMTVSNGAQGLLQVVLQGQTAGGENGGDDGGGNSISITSSQVKLGSSSGQTLYSGTLNNINDTNQLQMSGQLAASSANSKQLNIQIAVQIDNNQHISGTVSGSVA